MIKIRLKHTGSFKKTRTFLKNVLNIDQQKVFHEYGQLGVSLLSQETPVDTGKTAASWSYTITQEKDRALLFWTNSNTTASGIPIVILIHYGHGTPSGFYVEGRDFINPVVKKLFDAMAEDLWKEVTRL